MRKHLGRIYINIQVVQYIITIIISCVLLCLLCTLTVVSLVYCDLYCCILIIHAFFLFCILLYTSIICVHCVVESIPIYKTVFGQYSTNTMLAWLRKYAVRIPFP